MKRSAKSIVLIALLAVFAVLCTYLFIDSIVLAFKHIYYYNIAWSIARDWNLQYFVKYALIALSELISIAISVIFIIAIWKSKASKVVYELYGDKIESFKQRKAAKKEEKRKNKIEKLQNELTKLNNEEDE